MKILQLSTYTYATRLVKIMTDYYDEQCIITRLDSVILVEKNLACFLPHWLA